LLILKIKELIRKKEKKKKKEKRKKQDCLNLDFLGT